MTQASKARIGTSRTGTSIGTAGGATTPATEGILETGIGNVPSLDTVGGPSTEDDVNRTSEDSATGSTESE